LQGGKIRDLIFQLLENEEDVIVRHGTQSRENRRAATKGMHTSKFCLKTLLVMLKVTAFLRECNQVGEDHPTETDMEERVNGAGLDVLGMVVVQPSLYCTLHIV
jgi:hypothetical protein